jgi:uncharacterized membrane protein YccF (DUF307 family)
VKQVGSQVVATVACRHAIGERLAEPYRLWTTTGDPMTTANSAPLAYRGPGLLIRALWFICIGWWLSAAAIGLAYFLCVTIIGLPLAFIIFNQLPLILTLRPRSPGTEVDGTEEQLPLWLRAIWFVLVGWWFGGIYLGVAWFLCVILITLPIGLWLMNRVGAVMTLLRY